MSKRYDVVVIGGRLSAVVTGALLAKRELRGVLVDQGELATIGSFERADFPLVNGASRIRDWVHGQLGLKDDFNRLPTLEPLMQVIWPDSRFDVVGTGPRDREQACLRSEWGPGLGLEDRQVRAAFTALAEVDARVERFLLEAPELPPPAGFFARRSAQSAARKTPELLQTLDESDLGAAMVSPLRQTLLALLPFFTHLDLRDAGDLTVARIARPLLRVLTGLVRFEPGRSDRSLILELAERKALEVRRTAVERLVPEGKGWEVHLAGARDAIRADVVVDASTDLGGLDAIPSKQQGRQLPLVAQAARPRGALHGVGFELDRAVLPPDMATHLLLLNGRRDRSRFDADDPFGEDRPIWLTLRPGREAQRVQLLATQPVSTVRARGSQGAPVEEVMRARIERLIPFFAEGRPESFALETHRFGASFMPHPFFEPNADDPSGLGGVSMRTPIKNLFLAGPSVIPALGAEGEYLAAIQVADAVEALHRGKKVPRALAALAQ